MEQLQNVAGKINTAYDFDGNEYAKYQFTNNNFNGSGNYSSTGIATIEGESIFGITGTSIITNGEFDDGTTGWVTSGTWATGDDARRLLCFCNRLLC